MTTGGNTGNNIGSVQLDAFKSHTHTANAQGSPGGGATTSWAQSAVAANNGYNQPVSVANTGGNETRPINAYVNYIIKY